jgi:hypothetical protein
MKGLATRGGGRGCGWARGSLVGMTEEVFHRKYTAFTTGAPQAAVGRVGRRWLDQ